MAQILPIRPTNRYSGYEAQKYARLSRQYPTPARSHVTEFPSTETPTLAELESACDTALWALVHAQAEYGSRPAFEHVIEYHRRALRDAEMALSFMRSGQ